MEEQTVYKGLAGVPVDYTAISSVNPATNSLLYRGYPVQELTAQCSATQVALLLWNGELPSDAEVAAFDEFERAHREVPAQVAQVLAQLPQQAHPMDVVRTAVSLLGAYDPAAEENTPEANLRKAHGLFAVLPAIIAADQRRRRGEAPVAARADLGYVENFLWMTFGEEPAAELVDAFRVASILYNEHSFNASTFTARVIASTTADLYSAVTGAVGALKGALHGGANEAVMHTFDEIGSAERVGEWLDAALANKQKIMGFGHRVYKQGDSRVPMMQQVMDRMLDYRGDDRLRALYYGLAEEFTARKGIYPNLDYPAGPTYHLIGFDTPTFTPLFVAARVVGWTAHILEQNANNSLIRPLSVYNGPAERHLS